MFTKKITDSDAFTELPPTTQSLYFHLCMGADDDGFSNQIRKAMFNAHADRNDFELLVLRKFIIPFDNGVIVIKHWRMHNLIKNDRYKETSYIEEKSTLVLKDNGVYTVGTQVEPKWNQSGTQVEPQVSIGKESIGKDSIEDKPKRKRFSPPSVEDVRQYCEERNNGIDAERFVNFYESKGWMVGKNKMKDWKASVRTWEKMNKEFAQRQADKNKFNQFTQNQYDWDELEKEIVGNA